MKLLRMTATFGKLSQQTLTLTDGLNVLQMPNEAGKSTWAEFLLAMLYGVDTSEREKAGVLPVKTKFQPWSGKAMEGCIELLHEGQSITITRTSTARAPLSVFSAVYTQSGLPVEGMTGANCGELLLGVPKSVYQRSAFVRQAGLGLTPDAGLEARLAALVTTGDETVNYAAADKRLQGWQNRVRHNKTGLIPDCEQALAQTEQMLTALKAEHEKNLSLREQLQQLQTRQEEARAALADAQAMEVQQKKQQLYDAKRAAMQAANRENAAAAVCARLPREETLHELLADAQTLLSAPKPEAPPKAPEKPHCPQAFVGVDEDDLMECAQRDMRQFDRLTARKHRPSALFWVFTALFVCAAAAGGALTQNPLLALGCVVLAMGSAAVALLYEEQNKKREAELDQAQALLVRYDLQSRDEFAVAAADYRQTLQAWHAACEKADEQARIRAAHARQLAEQTAALLGSVRMFAQAEDAASAQTAIAEALRAYGAYHEAQSAVQQANARYAALLQAFGDLPELPVPSGTDAVLSKDQAEAALRTAQELCMQVRSQLDQSRGRLEQFGSEAELAARQQELAQQLADLQTRKAALELARTVLTQANTTLTARFSPRLVREASAIFEELTDGRYARVQIDRQMNLQAGQPDEAMRRLLSLSGGTADGLYLAVRLAICHLLLPPDAPLVLDDALVMFDDTRLKRALTVLQREAEDRQILLFTCNSAERRALGGEPAEDMTGA